MTTAPNKHSRPELAPWQYEIGGVVLGTGSYVPIGNVEGLGSPGTRPQDADNSNSDGTSPGRDFYGPRPLRFEAGIKTPGDPVKAAEILARLERALDTPDARTNPDGRHVLRGRWPGHATRRMYGRLRRMEATSTANAVHGWIPLDIEFVGLDDPRWYDDELSKLTLGLDQAARPRSGDWTVDEAMGRPAACRRPADQDHYPADDRPGWVTNHGDVPTYPSLRVHGPVTDPRIWNTVTRRVLELDLSLRDGEWVEMETRPGTCWALRNGTVNVANDLSPASRLDLFTLPPGRSEIAWSANDPSGTARLEVAWRSAYTTL
ncbi:phage tail domain-containing protein [Streptomyces sp. NBRC 110028]|uniref:phage tail domain-containing protein n=1 Tax=Streptomyces sp. NBRC 110028 TaxID=1621260 RepID=UPI0006E31642|nr:phage tail domain-containing protein [Streptomyces sp. NBRC 110028]